MLLDQSCTILPVRHGAPCRIWRIGRRAERVDRAPDHRPGECHSSGRPARMWPPSPAAQSPLLGRCCTAVPCSVVLLVRVLRLLVVHNETGHLRRVALALLLVLIIVVVVLLVLIVGPRTPPRLLAPADSAHPRRAAAAAAAHPRLPLAVLVVTADRAQVAVELAVVVGVEKVRRELGATVAVAVSLAARLEPIVVLPDLFLFELLLLGVDRGRGHLDLALLARVRLRDVLRQRAVRLRVDGRRLEGELLVQHAVALEVRALVAQEELRRAALRLLVLNLLRRQHLVPHVQRHRAVRPPREPRVRLARRALAAVAPPDHVVCPHAPLALLGLLQLLLKRLGVKRPRLEGEDVGQADEEELLALLRTRHLRQLEAKRRGRRHGGWPWRGARCVVVVVVVLALRPEEVVLLDLLLVARGARGVGRLTRWLVLRGRRGRRGRRLLVVGLVLRVRSEELIVLLSIHGVGKKGASEQRGAAASR
mmetsp:Transcript_62070/g.164692  ORF Transcript_62070/g.164692 Transcript_62070/m.164692 type:complete len:479 (-) Transcript_62070:4-1440(-)